MSQHRQTEVSPQREKMIQLKDEAFEAEEPQEVGDEAEEPPKGTSLSLSSSTVKAPARQYIRDRCDGKSKYGDSRPRLLLRPCLPPPCVKWFPGCLEQNPVCKLAGSCGLIDPHNDRARRRVFYVALASNVIGMILTIVACCSISLHYDTLMRTAFSSGSSVSDNPDIPGLQIGIGLRGVAIRRPILEPKNVVYTFRQFCERGFRMGTLQYFGDEVCLGCAEKSAGLVSTLILSLISYFPNIFTDVLRMYSNYDVNCQKMFGSFITLVSLLLSLYTWRQYRDSCFAVFYEGIIPYNTQGLAMAPEEVDTVEKRLNILVNMDYDWKRGPGLICVVSATFLKIVDILCNMIVPTPTITRDPKEQEEYENM